MRSALWGIVVAGSTLAGGLTLGAACGSLPTDCIELYACLGGGGSPGSSSSSSASSLASSSSGTGGGPPATCVPTAGMDPVDDTCGVFVSSSLGADSASAGSKANPYKTLAAAIKAAGPAKKPVYACSETFTETLTVAVGVGLYGGINCTNKWSYAGDVKSTLTTDADAVPLTLSASANGASLFDFKVQAADAMLSGGSSIAVIADQVTAAFTRCDLIAGNGKDGLAGVTSTVGVGPNVSTDPQIRGNDGSDACTDANNVNGGLPKTNNLCMLPSNPIGGLGGNGLVSNGTNGQAIVANTQTAVGGTGQAFADVTLNCMSGNGQTGAPGMLGNDGAGAIGMSTIGQVGSSGYTGVPGKAGVDGNPGQGGGGGGGAKGKAGCAGASGGGGGTGGCGGHGGTGGMAGGASIALVSLGATLSFNTVTVALGAGGVGGDGGEPQGGGAGGFGGFGGLGMGPGLSPGCRGGDGGLGGDGGKGGGGRGGHAIGIAASGDMAPATKGVKFSQKGKSGLGGKGGPSQDGDPGVVADVQMSP